MSKVAVQLIACGAWYAPFAGQLAEMLTAYVLLLSSLPPPPSPPVSVTFIFLYGKQHPLFLYINIHHSYFPFIVYSLFFSFSIFISGTARRSLSLVYPKPKKRWVKINPLKSLSMVRWYTTVWTTMAQTALTQIQTLRRTETVARPMPVAVGVRLSARMATTGGVQVPPEKLQW